MKNKILLGAMLLCACMISVSVSAQLTVDNSGNVKLDKKLAIGTNQATNTSLNLYKNVYGSVLPFYGVYSVLKADANMPVGNCYAIQGHADASTFNGTTGGTYAKQMCGVLGEVSLKSSAASDMFGAGVAGVVMNGCNNGGVGVLGTIKSGIILPNYALGLYAGYFNGAVKVTSTVTAASFVTTSDARLKQNIKNIELQDAKSAILRLRPVSYYYKQPADSFLCMEDINTKVMEKQHYGLIAQEVKELLPDLVYEKEGDYMAINYVELIPLLIKEIQELSSEVEALKNEKINSITVKRAHSQTYEEQEAILLQNNPNPFSVDTKIGYQLPLTTQRATLCVYNMNGMQVAEYPVSLFGEGTITISAGALDAGMYLYSLIADGQVVDTKRMILTK